jgi:hypothetical protein
VEVGKPSRSQIDLEGLEALRKPGLYRMVLIFDNGKLKKKDENVWTGRIVGTAVFEVQVGILERSVATLRQIERLIPCLVAAASLP